MDESLAAEAVDEADPLSPLEIGNEWTTAKAGTRRPSKGPLGRRPAPGAGQPDTRGILDRPHATPDDLAQDHDLLRTQILQHEQSIVLGRLTARVCHSVNNSLQTLRGALTLALEEPDVPSAVVDYIRLCQVEAQREAKMVDQVRQIYRPQADTSNVDLPALLEDIVALTSDEAERLGVEIHQDIAPELPTVRGSAARLRLALLSLMLRMMDLAALSGRNWLRLRAGRRESTVALEVTLASAPLSSPKSPASEDVLSQILDDQLASSVLADWVKSQAGAIGKVESEGELGVWATLPA